MDYGKQIKKVIYCLSVGLFLFINASLVAQRTYEDNTLENFPSLYGGKPLLDNQLTVGGRKFKNIQPQYGGKKIDERSLYNPHLEESFNYMGKPLFSPNPYNYPRLIDPYIYNQNAKSETLLFPSDNSNEDVFYPRSLKKYSHTSQPKRKKEESTPPIIPVLIGTIDAMHRENNEEKSTSQGSKRLSLDEWYGNIRTTTGHRGTFSFHNMSGGTVSGSYSKIGSRINYNINYYEDGRSENWQGSSSRLGRNSNISGYGDGGYVSGSSSSINDTYRYKFHFPEQNYEVEIRDSLINTKSIRVRGDKDIQSGYLRKGY